MPTHGNLDINNKIGDTVLGTTVKGETISDDVPRRRTSYIERRP